MKTLLNVLLVLLLGNTVHAQINLCPERGEYCNDRLRLYFQPGMPSTLEVNLFIASGDPRNGTYTSTTFGLDWIELEVDMSDHPNITVIIASSFVCETIPLTEVCQPDQCEVCPKKLIHHQQGKLCVVFEKPTPFILQEMSLDFGEGDPRNGTFSAHYITDDTLELTVPTSLCCGPLSCDIQIGEVRCTYKDNAFDNCHPTTRTTDPTSCSCEGLLGNCNADIVDYLQIQLNEKSCQHFLTACNPTAAIHRMGKVAIGTNEIPSGYAMAVKGGVTANRIIVELCEAGQWCDYVFEEHYPLLTLEQVEDHIHQHGHLHRTPSAAQIMEDGGFELKQTKLNQQEKIEEIFLHLIAANKQVELLKMQAVLLEKENVKLKAQQKF